MFPMFWLEITTGLSHLLPPWILVVRVISESCIVSGGGDDSSSAYECDTPGSRLAHVG